MLWIGLIHWAEDILHLETTLRTMSVIFIVTESLRHCSDPARFCCCSLLKRLESLWSSCAWQPNCKIFLSWSDASSTSVWVCCREDMWNKQSWYSGSVITSFCTHVTSMRIVDFRTYFVSPIHVELKFNFRSQYKQALRYAPEDIRLHNMCKGLWSRLQYVWKLKRQARLNGVEK